MCYPAERRPVLEEAVDDFFELFLNGDSSKISTVFYTYNKIKIYCRCNDSCTVKIPAGDGKIFKLFLQCVVNFPIELM